MGCPRGSRVARGSEEDEHVEFLKSSGTEPLAVEPITVDCSNYVGANSRRQRTGYPLGSEGN